MKENLLREQIDSKHMDEINRFNDLYSYMFSLDFDSPFWTVEIKTF